MKKATIAFISILFLILLPACNLSAASNTAGSAKPTAKPEAQSTVSPNDDTTSSLPAGMPTVETDFGKMLGVLQSGKFSYIAGLVNEKYDANAYTVPGKLVFTASIPASETVYLNYGWCAKDTTTLKQNLQHIQLSFYFNDQQIPVNYISTLSTQTDENLKCSNTGMLLSGWTPGVQRFRILANFAQAINDGFADYGSGDYITEYTVTVN
jgi:hypothetical protein